MALTKTTNGFDDGVFLYGARPVDLSQTLRGQRLYPLRETRDW